ncbi:MAG: hypothetical protein IPL13_08355 [Saprospiraceae bacterium]|nr:hypothetical protein [Candidatus Brachybacter algidus]
MKWSKKRLPPTISSELIAPFTEELVLFIRFLFVVPTVEKGFLALAAISMIGGMTLTWSGFYNKKSEFRDFAMGWER